MKLLVLFCLFAWATATPLPFKQETAEVEGLQIDKDVTTRNIDDIDERETIDSENEIENINWQLDKSVSTPIATQLSSDKHRPPKNGPLTLRKCIIVSEAVTKKITNGKAQNLYMYLLYCL